MHRGAVNSESGGELGDRDHALTLRPRRDGPRTHPAEAINAKAYGKSMARESATYDLGKWALRLGNLTLEEFGELANAVNAVSRDPAILKAAISDRSAAAAEIARIIREADARNAAARAAEYAAGVARAEKRIAREEAAAKAHNAIHPSPTATGVWAV